MNSSFFQRLKLTPQTIFLLIYALVSLHYLSSFYPVGSLEAKLFLTKRTSVVNWEKFQLGAHQAVPDLMDADTFLNYDPDKKPMLNGDPASKPSLYIRGENKILPLMAQPKTGSIPYIIIRSLASLVSPSSALIIFTWVCSLVTFAAAISFVNRSSGPTGPYGLLSLITPQIVFFIGPSYPDFHLATVCFFLLLYLFETGTTRRHFLIIGTLLGFCLYTKLSMLMFLPLFIILFPAKIWSFKKQIILGTLPVLLITAAFLQFYSYDQIVTKDRVLLKDLGFISGGVGYFVYYFLHPGLLFAQMIDDVKPLWETLSSQTVWFHLSTLVMLFLYGVFSWGGMNLKSCIQIGLCLGILILGSLAVAKGYSEDLFVYFSFLTYFLITVAIAKLKITRRLSHKTLMVLFASLVILKGLDFISWNKSFNQMTRQLKGCLWTYECIYNDWKKQDLLKGRPLVTFFYLDVGQFEFFSGEKLIPIHLTWKYMKKPSPEEFEDFMLGLPYSEFFSLWSEERDLTTFMNGSLDEATEKLKSKGLKWELVSIYEYPELYRSYKLVKFSRIK